MRSLVHMIGLQDFLAVPQANIHLCPQEVGLDYVSSKAHAAVQAAEPEQGGTFQPCRACPSSAQSHAALASRVSQTIEVGL